jgi:hypothetical protein
VLGVGAVAPGIRRGGRGVCASSPPLAGRRRCHGSDYGLGLFLEKPVNEEALNHSIRKFLKTVGVSSQREIEKAVERAVAAGATATSFPATMKLSIPSLGLDVSFDATIDIA